MEIVYKKCIFIVHYIYLHTHTYIYIYIYIYIYKYIYQKLFKSEQFQ